MSFRRSITFQYPCEQCPFGHLASPNPMLKSLLSQIPMTTIGISKTRDEFLIYAAMLLVLGTVYGGTLATSAEMHAPNRLIPFTGLMTVHTILHLIVPRLSPRHLWLPFYFVLQGILAFILIAQTYIVGTTLSFYLYLVLAAQAIGLLSNRPRLAAGITIAYLLAGILAFVWFWGWAALPSFLVLAGLQTLFVLACAALFFRQANERRRAQTLLRNLELAHRQLAEYAGQIEDLTLTNERQRLARELHDTLAQGLAGLILQLEAIDKQLSHSRYERAHEITSQAMAKARAALADARQAIDDLRIGEPPIDDFTQAIRHEAERFMQATGIACSVEISGTENIILPDNIHHHALRVVTEGLTNVARHASASQVLVNVETNKNIVCVSMRDNGVGFKPEDTNVQSGHYGLIGMGERARLVGGSMEVSSAPGQGTTLILRIPLSFPNLEKPHA
jgi:NarL family two-component system sensor histidine kinase YdfH